VRACVRVYVCMYAYMTQLNRTRRTYLVTRQWPEDNVSKTVTPKYASAKMTIW